MSNKRFWIRLFPKATILETITTTDGNFPKGKRWKEHFYWDSCVTATHQFLNLPTVGSPWNYPFFILKKNNVVVFQWSTAFGINPAITGISSILRYYNKILEGYAVLHYSGMNGSNHVFTLAVDKCFVNQFLQEGELSFTFGND